ncbi:6110_t:CDS:1 [Paraglomus occultum]|uniref:6110_t:CDS:1 n=1 Tax=Paraglomus occultum TaxID=144539 RepID=A0A9N9FVP5_9GLOM|nr:6110_t:CDS:1 [Paraglomus occultum]
MSEEQMEEVELILTDCEKLVINDLELEAIIARTTRVIEEAKFRMININVNEKIEIAEEEKQFLENLLSVLQEHMKGRKSINALGKFLEGFQTAKETLQTKISEKKFWSLFEKLEEETKLEGAVEARMEVLDKKN